jgi:glycerol-3-phosphate dehydrogenase
MDPAERNRKGPQVERPILVLGAGINGCAIARELLLNRIPVVLVDRADLASGTTAYSSRLIHGGLRYLEHAEFSLVRESLAERGRLLRLAPQFVRPLRLFIPVESRWGGMVSAARRFLHWERKGSPHQPRGLNVVRMGLTLYDWYARDPDLPRHRTHSLGCDVCPPVDATKYHWMCSYYDGQIRFPERFVVALVKDGAQIAKELGIEFSVRTYCEARRVGEEVEVAPLGGNGATERWRPSAIINATGAWVDETLGELQVRSPRLIGGTKGSHLLSYQKQLRACLGPEGVYAEARDGRPIFVLPFGEGTLIGTTDERFDGPPDEVVASPSEIDYLIATVNELFPQVGMTAPDVSLHYSGVRPLPAVPAGTTAAITRRHWLQANPSSGTAMFSVIGGKLTTCRSLAEESVEQVLPQLGLRVEANSSQRFLPGGEGAPADAAGIDQLCARWSSEFGLSQRQARSIWELCGMEGSEACGGREEDAGTVGDSDLPRQFVRWSIEHEWVQRLSDLVERRLMLLYQHDLSRTTLRELAGLLAESGRISSAEIDSEVSRVATRLERHFGKRVVD